MAGTTTVFAGDLLALLYNGTTIANIANNAVSAPITNWYISLHTADPGASGNQTTNEAAYTSYARVAVARTTGGFVVTGNSVSPAATIVFPTATGGSETELYFGIGTASSGTGLLAFSGPITPGIAVAVGVTPELTTATAQTQT